MRKMLFIVTFLLLITVLLCPATAEQDTTPPTLSVNVVADSGTVRVYGTATSASGIDRVEVKFNDGSWRTADLNGNSFSITDDIAVTGNHVVHVRAFDRAGNPSQTETKTFYAVKKATATDDDLSFYVRLASVKLTSLNLSGNVREMDYTQDFCVDFEIVNDDSVSHRLRYRIDVNGEETTEDVTVQAGRSKDVDEWYSASILSAGQNRIKISLIDWETRQTITDKTIILNVKSDERPAASNGSAAEMPDWLKEFAEINGLMLPQNNTQMPNTAVLEAKIVQLETKVSKLEDEMAAPVESKSEMPSYFWLLILAAGLIGLFFLYRSGKLDNILKKDDGDDKEDAEEEFQEN